MNNYFCRFSYKGSCTSVGNTYCCRLAPGFIIEDVRDSIKNKERSSACSTCWKLENQVLEKNKKYHNEVSAFLNYGGRLLEQFWQEIDRQDQLKGTNIKNYLPELAATRI